MKKKILVAMVMAVAVILPAGVAMAADAANDQAGLIRYRVVSEMSVELGQVMELFVPSLSGGKKFLPPKVNGIGLIHRWNPQLAGATWETLIQQGDTIRLPGEWVLRIQNVLDPVEAPPQLNWNPETDITMTTGGESWLYVVVIGVGAGLFYVYVSVRLFRRRPCQPWRRI